GLGLVLYCGKLLDEERTAETPAARAHAHLMLDVLTPIAKSWPSQYCLQANDLAIQVYGGYGYTRSTRARTGSRRSTCSAARSSWPTGPGSRRWRTPCGSRSPRRSRQAAK